MSWVTVSLFAVQGSAGSELLLPEPLASGWAPDHMRGMAISGALARAVEQTVAARGRADLQPARWTLDLFRPARMQPCRVSATVVREGRRLCLVDAVFEQADQVVARASALFLHGGTSPGGVVWSPQRRPLPPSPGLVPDPLEPRLHYSDDAGWTSSPGGHQNGSRKQVWHFPVSVVKDERPSPFQLVASVADVTNLVTNWGSAGLQFINADVTLLLARLPAAMEVGLAALDHVQRDGIAVGTAVVYDRVGSLGTATVSAVANADRALDVAGRAVGEPRPAP
jgi:hypothetical protein